MTQAAAVPECDRCGSRQFRDIDIHGGQSTRRDCAWCGRFHSWPRWYGVAAGSQEQTKQEGR